jgi:hypothetical protein
MCPVQNVNHVPVHSALSEVWFLYSCALAHRNCQGRVAAGTGRRGGSGRRAAARAREETSARGKIYCLRISVVLLENPDNLQQVSEKLPIPAVCPMMEPDGYAPSWVSKPKQKHRDRRRSRERFPTPLRRGAMDVCPGFAAKGPWNRVFLPVFELPDEVC